MHRSAFALSWAAIATLLALSGQLPTPPEAQAQIISRGDISFEVVSNGMTGEEWIKHLEAKGVVIGDWAKALLRSDRFRPTNGVRYQVRILRWDGCSGCNRVQDIISEAKEL